MHKKFEVYWTKIKGSCQSYTKAAPQQSWSDLTLAQHARLKLNEKRLIKEEIVNLLECY